MKTVFILIPFVFLQSFLIAQVDYEKPVYYLKELNIADNLYAQGAFYSAIEYYKEAIRLKPESRYPRYWLAMAYLKSADYANACRFFNSFKSTTPPKKKIKRLEKENNEIYGLSNYYYGIALKQNENYEEAISKLKKFISSYDMPDKEEWLAKAKNELKGAEMALNNLKSWQIQVLPLSELNSNYEDAAPVPVNDTLIYYTSLNQNSLVFVDHKKNLPNYNLYQSVKRNGTWEHGKKLPRTFQDEKFGTGNAALSADGNRIYFCKSYRNEFDEVIGNIYISEKNKAGRWQEAVALNSSINSPKYTSTQPTVRQMEDGMEMVYFVSDREGGKGGMDIWYFIRTARGDFKGPRLLKGDINTIGDELTPFYDNSQDVFFFSSNGHPSIGGFDIFLTKENEDLGWSKPINLGKPLNSPSDDLYYVREANKNSGFLVSNRVGAKKISEKYPADDIFYFQDILLSLKGYVFRETSTSDIPLDGTTVNLYLTNSSREDKLIDSFHALKNDFSFRLQPNKEYKLEVIKEGFSSAIELLSTEGLSVKDTIYRNILLSKTFVKGFGSLYASSDTLKQNKLDNAVISLYEIQDDGQKKLISSKRLPKNQTDFSFNLQPDKDYVLEVVKEEFFKKVENFSTKNISDLDEMDISTALEKIEVGKTYALPNILYAFGKANLGEESYVVLDELVQILKDNPNLVIEVASHTDNIGSDATNLNLSQKRAESCVNYLISKGISPDRVLPKGYGETKPVAANETEGGEDNPEGRALNRRTEFTIIDSF